MQLTLEYPSWYLLFCVLAGLTYAGILYIREKSFSDRPAWVRGLMGALRFLSAALLTFFLLSPVLRSILRESRKPILIVGQDISESVGSVLSGAARLRYAEALQGITRTLGKDFDVRYYSFGASVKEGLDTTFRDKASDLAGFLRYLRYLQWPECRCHPAFQRRDLQQRHEPRLYQFSCKCTALYYRPGRYGT